MKTRKQIILLASVAALLSSCGSSTSKESSEPTSSIEPTTSITSSEETTSPTTTTSEDTTSSEEGPQKQIQMLICNGGADINQETQIVTSRTSNTLGICRNATLRKGTISASFVFKEKECNGLIFNVDRGSKSSFYENPGVSYYYFFIDQNGTARLAKVDNGMWMNLIEQPAGCTSLTNAYKLEVSLDTTGDKTIVNCFVDDIFMFSYKDSDQIMGYEYGFRIQSVGGTMTFIEQSEEFKEEERLQVNDYYIASGMYSYSKNKIAYTDSHQSGVGSIMYKEENLGTGTFSTDMRLAGSAGCNGLIFGLDSADQTMFWETGVSYYFFFLDEIGYARLAKVNNGSWTDLILSDYPIANFSYTGTFNLKVVRDSTTIDCYVDDNKLFSFVDSEPLVGDYYGFRSQNFGVCYKNIVVEAGEEIQYNSPTNYDCVSGEFVTANDVFFIAKGRENIALHKTHTLTTGTLTAKLHANSAYSTGVIFRSDATGNNCYLFTIAGNYCKLSKKVNGVVSDLTPSKFVTASHRNGSEETMVVSIDGNTIRCYVRGILYAIYEDSNILSGNKCGIYSSRSAATFNDIELAETPYRKTAKTLVIGHSYMELWRKWETDLANYDDVYNIGIGGSIASQWNQMENEIVDYNPTTLIYMIGTNDVVDIGGVPAVQPAQIRANVQKLLSNLKAKIPGLNEVALVSCCRCPVREPEKNYIASLNAQYKELCADPTYSSYVKYADIDNAFLVNGNPDASYFIDGLHPSDAGYIVIRDAINVALGR